MILLGTEIRLSIDYINNIFAGFLFNLNLETKFCHITPFTLVRQFSLQIIPFVSLESISQMFQGPVSVNTHTETVHIHCDQFSSKEEPEEKTGRVWLSLLG